MPERYDLDSADSAGRQGIDAGWSARKKGVVSSVCVVIAAAAVFGGAYTLKASSPPEMPTTAQEALDVLSSKRFEKLSADRRTQYLEETRRLFWELSPEEREELRADEKAREQMQEAWRRGMDDMARRMARGEEIDWSQFRRPRGEGRQRNEDRPEPTEEERDQRRAQMRDRINQAVSDQLSSGNAQSSALQSEMWSKMRGQRGGRGGGARGGGNRGGGS